MQEKKSDLAFFVVFRPIFCAISSDSWTTEYNDSHNGCRTPGRCCLACNAWSFC